MFTFKIVSITLLLILKFLNILSLDCSQYSTETQCKNAGGCLWLTQSSKCQCASTTQIDIVFGIDKSGSITADGFEKERQFLLDLVTGGVLSLSTTRIAFVEFSDNVYTTKILGFYSESNLVNFIKNIYYTQGYTNTKGELNYMMAEYDARGSDTRSKFHILITDGNPCRSGSCPYSVCDQANAVKSRGIRVILMLVGPNIDEERLDCLTLDPTSNPNEDIIRVASFSQSSFTAIMPQLSNIVCPVTYEGIITEVGPLHASSAIFGSRFIEFYNTGVDMDLSKIVVSGTLINTKVNTNGIGTNQEGITLLPQNKYLVLYDKDSYDTTNDPNKYSVTCNGVKQCNCNLRTNNEWCVATKAVYIGCCAASSCPCTFVTDSVSNRASWTVTIQDNSGSSLTTIDTVTHDGTFPLIPTTGYKYELVSLTSPNNIGSNWIVSCYITGTPGSSPVDGCTSCTAGSTTDPCATSGGTCSSNTGTCTCPSNKFNTGSSCTTIPAVNTCKVTISKDYSSDTGSPQGIERAKFTWTAATISADKDYVLTVPNIADPSATSSYSTYDRIQELSSSDYQSTLLQQSTYGWVQVRIPPEIGNLGEKTLCDVYTEAPTASPTNAPTYSPSNGPTKSPTNAPTPRQRLVYLIDDICENERCECYGNSDMNCCIGDNDCDMCSLNCESIISKIWQRAGPWLFTIERFPQKEYLYDMNIFWRVVWVYDKYINKINESDIVIDYNSSLSSGLYGFQDYFGNITIDKNTPSTGKESISLYVTNNRRRRRLTKTIEDIQSSNYNIHSIYYLELINCTDNYPRQDCAIVYPTKKYISISENNRASVVTEKKVPKWILPLVLGLIAFGIILGIILYAIWRKTAKQKNAIDDNYNALDDAYNENEMNLGDQLNTGDIQANALATGVPGLNANKGGFDAQIQARAEQQNEFADVNAEKFNERQQIGQVQG